MSSSNASTLAFRLFRSDLRVLLSVLLVSAAVQELDDERGLDQRAYHGTGYSPIFSRDDDLELYDSRDLPSRYRAKAEGMARDGL